MANKILCGLDIGTNSVGWCVTDENNQVIKKNGKSLWGVRMFEEAKDCKDRRAYRCSRRRLKRRKQRIDLLQELFAVEMQKTDADFFYRLSSSFFHNEDRERPFDFTLFNDINYSDKQYFLEYPTIYHLRKKLIITKEKMDLRFIYLALHHMIKYRGNFLVEGDFQAMKQSDADEYFEELSNFLSANGLKNIAYSDDIFRQLKLANEEENRITDLKKRIGEILQVNNDDFHKKVIIPLIVGSPVKLKDIKKLDIELDKLEFDNLCTKSEDFVERIEILSSFYPDYEDYFRAFITCQKICQFFQLGKLIGKHQYLSDVMIERYEKHEKDLRELKDYIKKNFPNEYGRVFRKPNKSDNKAEDNYSSYIGYYSVNGELRRFEHAKADDFYKFLKDILQLKNYRITDENKNEYLSRILIDMENGNFLPLLNSTDNGLFPYQLNLIEMKAILNNQKVYYPFLLEKDDDGTVLDKIISLLTFKIPYYVGPLTSKSNHAWIVRKEGKIYPWNFDKMVDKEKTAENFIRRMLNKCSYLPSCYCLPKNSIVFSYYDVLSFVNKLVVNGALLGREEKMALISDVFAKNRKVNKSMIKEYFKNKYGDNDIEVATANGKELDIIPCNMASYYDFVNIFGQEYVKSHIDIIEQVIRDIVLFEDKKVLVERLENSYQFNSEQIKRIKGLNYAKYSRLSKELLLDLKAYDDNGVIIGSILDIMQDTNENLMQVITNEKYHLQEIIMQYNQDDSQGTIESYVDELYVAPGMKRPLIQAFKIIEELEKILKRPIDEYYVECTRTNKEQKVPAKSRYEKLKEIYAAAEEAMRDDFQYKKVSTELKELANGDINKFQSDKYFLYFLQMGKCMYSGEPIELSDLDDSHKYDIDHIIPQMMIKDDSLNNRVLVKQDLNRDKSDTYPIPHSVLFKGNYKAAYAFYKHLRDCGFISQDKYVRLTRVELKEDEYASFVNRQLVYTNQAVKGLIMAIEYFKSDSKHKPRIVYSKSENVSDFRQCFGIIKSRTANNFHHAHDAYLNIVVGRAIDSHFNPFRQNEKTLHEMHKEGLTTNPIKIFFPKNDDKLRFVYDANGYVAWNPYTSLSQVKKQIFECFDIFTTTRTYVGSAIFGKCTIYPATMGNIPIKNNLPTDKYGGLKEYAFGQYCLIRMNDDYILEAIPTMYKDNVMRYLSEEVYKDSVSQLEIIIPVLKINTVIEMENKRFCISGKSGNSYYIKNLYERRFGKQELEIIKKIEKLKKVLDDRKCKKIDGQESLVKIKEMGFSLTNDTDDLIISPARNNQTKAIVLSHDECLHLYHYLIELYQKRVFSYGTSNNLVKNLREKESLFLNLSILGKYQLLFNLLGYLKCNERASVDLSLLGMSKNSLVMTISKKLHNCKIVAESITGYYRKVLMVID